VLAVRMHAHLLLLLPLLLWQHASLLHVQLLLQR
jgi:hypothetical protein